MVEHKQRGRKENGKSVCDGGFALGLGVHVLGRIKIINY